MTFVSTLLSSNIALIRELPKPARVSLFIFFMAGFSDGVLMPFFALWAQNEAGVSVEYIGLVFTFVFGPPETPQSPQNPQYAHSSQRCVVTLRRETTDLLRRRVVS